MSVNIFNILKTKKVFVLCEKLNQAQSYADALNISGNKKEFFRDGNLCIGGAQGHLLELYSIKDYDSKLDKFYKINTPYIPEEYKYKIRTKYDAETETHIKDEYINSLFEKIKSEIMQADVIINATDAGREGEAIFYKIYNYIKEKKEVYRLWIHSMENSEIKKGFENLLEEEEKIGLQSAAKMRELADWCFGINATVCLTNHHRTMYNCGRVQTPVLVAIKKRYDKVKSHIPLYYYKILLEDARYKLESEEEYQDEKEAQEILNKTEKVSIFKERKTHDTNTNPPRLFSLTTLQKHMNKKYSWKPIYTLEILQKLYENKYTSYPRTDAQFLTTDMKETFEDLLMKIHKTKNLENTKIERASTCFNNEKVEDHYAIIPLTAGVDAMAKVEGDEKILLDVVIDRAYMQILDKYQITTETYVYNNNEKDYIYKNILIRESGWKEIEKIDKDIEEEEETNYNTSAPPQNFIHAKKEISRKEKGKPKFYTDDTILTYMQNPFASENDKEILKEVGGIGTSATRANVLETLEKRGYIVHEKKNIIPTEKGNELFEVAHDLYIADVHATAELEKKLLEIERSDKDVVVKETRSLEVSIEEKTKTICDEIKNQESKHKNNVIGKCPICEKGDMVEWQKNFSCSAYKKDDENSCRFTIWKEIAGKKITVEIAEELITKKRTGKITGFISRKKEEFSAELKIDENEKKVVFDFK